MADNNNQNVGKQAAKAASWLVLAKILTQGIRSARLVVLAAIIPAEQLGLFGIALVAMLLLQQLSETGMRRALIQFDGDISHLLPTGQTVQIGRGIILALAIFLLAPQAEIFFEKEGLANLLRLLAIVPFLNGFNNIGEVHLHRELRLKKVVVLQFVLTVVEFGVALAICIARPKADSLIYAQIASAAVGLVGSYIIEKRWTHWAFSRTAFMQLYRFGFWVFVSALLSFLLVRGSDLIIGKLLPAADLAVYQIAYGIACMPIIEITRVLNTTAFSAFSRIQSEPQRLGEAFLKMFYLTCSVGALSVGGFLLFGQIFTDLFLKSDYQVVGMLLPWLAIWGACRALGATNSVLFQAIGKPAYATVFQFVMVLLFVSVLVPLASLFGIEGVVYSLVGIGLFAQATRYLFLLRFISARPSQIAIRLFIPVVCGLVATGATYLVLSVIPAEQKLLAFFLGTTLIVLLFAAVSFFVDRQLNFGVGRYLTSNIVFLRRFRATQS